jgi:hypothetical protein
MDPEKNTLDKKGRLRFDFLFSYWIFFWFLIFYFIDKETWIGKFMYKYLNPTIALWIGLLENIATFLFMIIVKPSFDYVFKMILMTSFIKALPLYLIRNIHFEWKKNWITTLIVFGIYNVYLFANNTNVYEIYKRAFISFYKGSNETPLFALIQSLY